MNYSSHPTCQRGAMMPEKQNIIFRFNMYAGNYTLFELSPRLKTRDLQFAMQRNNGFKTKCSLLSLNGTNQRAQLLFIMFNHIHISHGALLLFFLYMGLQYY